MSERIDGLSIGLSLDTIKVDSGLTDLKSKMSLLNSELRNNMSAFDRGEKSVSKYQTQIEGLNKKVEAQKVITESARKTYEKAVEEFGEGSKEADKAATAYNNQASQLSNLERYVKNVTAEMKEFQKQQQVQNSTLFKAGSAFTGFGNGLKSISDKAKGLGQNLTKRITMPALGAVSALAGIALFKGFDRLIGIDTARAKLKGLGHDAEDVEKIMDSALESVKGTAFGLDVAATTAANAVAAGVEEGEELTRYLSLTGDAAAIAGTELGEMGSILNKVQTSNKAYNGELQQLSDRGLPIYQWLAEEAGVTADAVFDLASKGEISSEMLMNAIEKNIGGAAKKMGEESFTAGIANMWAAVGRLGASFLDAGGKGGGFFSQLKPLISDLTGRIDTMGDFAEKAGVKFGEFFTNIVDKAKSMKSAYDDLSPTVQGLISKTGLVVGALTVGIGPFLTVLGTFGGLIAKISTGLGTFLTMLAKSGGLLGALKAVFISLAGPIGITVGIVAALTTGFILLYKNSETFREGVKNLANRLKELGKQVLESLKTAIGAVVSFFKEQLKVLQGFWKENGDTIIQAVKNIGSVVGAAFNGIWEVIKFIMPAVLAIIKSVWGNIKGVISGALDVIMGLVKVFSGVFTGDFSKMWEGVKQIFSGAIQFVWNFIQLSFYGKILSGARVFITAFRTGFQNVWRALIDLFTKSGNSIMNFLRNTWNSINRTTNTVFTGIWNFLRNIWNTIVNFITRTINAIFTGIRNVWNNIFNTTRSVFENIRTAISNVFTGIRNFISTTVSNISTRISSTWNGIKKTTSTVFTNIFNTIKSRFTDIVSAAKELPKRIGDGIGSMASKVKTGVTKVINELASTLGKGVNGVIGGINWVLDKIGVTSTIPKWAVPQYAKGTDAHPGGLAIVGDGRGSNAGQELIQTPDGKMSLSPAKDTLVNLPKGTKVLSAKETKGLFDGIPKYASGIGNIASHAWDKVKDVGSKVKETALDVFDYIKSPGKLLDLALNTLGVSAPKSGSFVGNMAKGAWDKVKSGAVNFVKTKLTEFGETRGSGFGSPFRLTSRYGWRIHPITGRRTFHAGDDYGAPAGTPIPAQAAGIVTRSGYHALRGNYVRIKSGILDRIYQHNTRNLVGVGQTVRAGQPVGTVGSTGASTGPHLHYEVLRNGVHIDPKGYATGGLIKKPTLSMLAEEGYPEFVIPTDPKRRTDAMKLLALAAKSVGGGGSSQRPSGMSGNGGVFEDLLAATLEQNRILMQLLKKNSDIYLNGRAVAEEVVDDVDELLGGRNNIHGLVRGY